MNLIELEEKIVQWANDRNIIAGSTHKSQFKKLMEEAKEFSDHIDDETNVRLKDDIGDMLVVLTILARQIGSDLRECAEYAYDDIKDRKGRMIDGLFVKEADLIARGLDV